MNVKIINSNSIIHEQKNDEKSIVRLDSFSPELCRLVSLGRYTILGLDGNNNLGSFKYLTDLRYTTVHPLSPHC